MAEAPEAECWEDLDQLTLGEPDSKIKLGGAVLDGAEAITSNGGAPTGRAPAVDSTPCFLEQAAAADAAGPPAPEPLDAQEVDKAIAEALSNPRERATALRIDAEVEQFVADASRMMMEFPQEMTGYQRLLAHRISQHYGLQTSSVPGARNQSRVVARRCAQTCIPKVKITELKNVHCPPETAKAAPEVTIKRRAGGAASRSSAPHAGDGSSLGSGQVRTVKEREQEYKAARDRILGESSESGRGGGGAGGQKENVGDKGQKAADDAKSKAVFRNREKEMQDPDYRRCDSRFQRGFDPANANYFDRQNAQGLYNVRSYNTEFPVLQGARPAPTNVAAAPFYPPSMGQWPHHGASIPSASARNNSLGNHEQGGFQQGMSGPMGPGQQPYSMPAYSMPPHPYSMPRMHYAYTPDMMAGPSPPGPMYPPPAGSQHMSFRPIGMGQYRSVPGYMIPSIPGQEGMGMVPSMPYPVYGAYPNHPVGYPDYGDMHGYHGQHMVNGFAMGGHHDSGSVAGSSEHCGPGARGGGTGCASPRAEAGSVAPKVEITSKPQAVEN